MVVFQFLVLPNVASTHTLSQIYLGIWFWSTHGVTTIVCAVLHVSNCLYSHHEVHHRFLIEDLS